MGNFKSKPVEVDAFRYNGAIAPAKKFLGIKDAHFDADSRDLIVAMPNGSKAVVMKGEWLIKQGESFVVLSDESFKSQYEAV